MPLKRWYRFDYAPDQLSIEVRDNGQGAAPSNGHGHGLIGIRERVRLYDGEMTTEHTHRRGLPPHDTPTAYPARAVSIRVLVADDQSMVRAGFRMLLTGEQDIEVVAEASNGLEAVANAKRSNPAVVLMDIRMPEVDGIEATRRILAANSAARILILTTFGLDEYVYEALCAGASGFVLKDDPHPNSSSLRSAPSLRETRFSRRDHQTRDQAIYPHSAPAPPKGFGELTERSTKSCGSSRPACPTQRSARRSTSAKRP